MPDATSFDEPNDAAYQRVLAVLFDVGTSLVQELKTPSADLTVTNRAAAFDRVALALRRAILLSRHIAQSPVDTAARETKRTLARRRIIREVEETIGDKADPAEAPDLRVELLERVDSLDFDLDVTHRPPAELIRELCRDLGLVNMPGLKAHPRRTPDDIALLCAQAAAPAGSGLPQWLAAVTPQAERNDNARSSKPRLSSLSPRERVGVRASPHTDPPPPPS